MSWVGDTKRLPVRPDEDDWRPRGRSSGVVGVLAAVVTLLALLVGGAKAFAVMRELPGPPASEVALHAGAGVLAIVLALVARRAGAAGKVLAGVVVLAMGACLLWFYWYA